MRNEPEKVMVVLYSVRYKVVFIDISRSNRGERLQKYGKGIALAHTFQLFVREWSRKAAW